MEDNQKIIVHIDEDIEELIPGYLENRREDIQTLQAALKENLFKQINVKGHRMKGSGGGYGFTGISQIGKEMELAAEQEDKEKVDSLIKEMQDYLDRLEIVIDYEEDEDE